MPASPARLLEALRDWGCEPVERAGWTTRTSAGGWTPVGVLHHHTGGWSAKAPTKMFDDPAAQEGMLRMLESGRPDLDGPLCHLAPAMVPGTDRARVHLVGVRNANHAGEGRSRVAADLRAGRFDGGGSGPDAVDGNELLYGLEYLHPGVESVDWPDALLEVGARAACALAQAEGWAPGSWAGRQADHREWTGRKPDRAVTARVNPAAWTRDRVAVLARTGPAPAEPPAPTPIGDTLMLLKHQTTDRLYADLGSSLVYLPTESVLRKHVEILKALGRPTSPVDVGDDYLALRLAANPTPAAESARLAAQVAALAALVASGPGADTSPADLERIAEAAAQAAVDDTLGRLSGALGAAANPA